jgi:type IV pilus assembly protein PilB
MVGEIRDLETAEIAIKAAQTGHMVLSTLHTNDAPQTIARLMNMGIPPYSITSSVTLVIAQRLARRLHDCKKPQNLPPHALLAAGFTQADIDAGLTLYEAGGCEHCNEGYKGRVGIYQVMPMLEDIQKIVLQGGNALQIAEVARKAGINDLRASALEKVKNGVTSLAEIDRVTKD